MVSDDASNTDIGVLSSCDTLPIKSLLADSNFFILVISENTNKVSSVLGLKLALAINALKKGFCISISSKLGSAETVSAIRSLNSSLRSFH